MTMNLGLWNKFAHQNHALGCQVDAGTEIRKQAVQIKREKSQIGTKATCVPIQCIVEKLKRVLKVENIH